MGLDSLGIVGIISITVICYVIGAVVKLIPISNNQIIPVVCMVCGGILGIVGHYIGIEGLVSADVYMAIAQGAVSGWAAVGLNETVRNIKNAVSTKEAQVY